jgi:hypothetical protein
VIARVKIDIVVEEFMHVVHNVNKLRAVVEDQERLDVLFVPITKFLNELAVGEVSHLRSAWRSWGFFRGLFTALEVGMLDDFVVLLVVLRMTSTLAMVLTASKNINQTLLFDHGFRSVGAFSSRIASNRSAQLLGNHHVVMRHHGFGLMMFVQLLSILLMVGRIVAGDFSILNVFYLDVFGIDNRHIRDWTWGGWLRFDVLCMFLGM